MNFCHYLFVELSLYLALDLTVRTSWGQYDPNQFTLMLFTFEWGQSDLLKYRLYKLRMRQQQELYI